MHKPILATLQTGCSTINNEVYDDPSVSATWHQKDRTSQLATLQLLNAVCSTLWPTVGPSLLPILHISHQARIPFFDRVWRQQLQLSPERPGVFLEVGCGGGIATCALAKLGRAASHLPVAPTLLGACPHPAPSSNARRAGSANVANPSGTGHRAEFGPWAELVLGRCGASVLQGGRAARREL